MNDDRLRMLRMEVAPGALMRFAASQGLARVDDDGHGYTLHAWLTSMFGVNAPKPFRLLAEPGRATYTLLGYGTRSHDDLLQYAEGFADPHAFTALVPGSLTSKPMPATWREGARLRLEVLACPTSRKDDDEKDVYLRAIDRLGDAVPPRAQIYAEWLTRQMAPAVRLTDVQLKGFTRVRLARRCEVAGGGRRLLSVERPQVLFAGQAVVDDSGGFADLLRRGIGRHRAFGFGMLLLRPAG